jgi:hypothetical protein
MTARWFDIPEDWVDLNRNLRRTVSEVTRDATPDVRTIDSDTTIALTRPQTVIAVETAGSDVTITLPSLATNPGYTVAIKKLDAANTLTVDASGSETIDGALTLAWTTQYQSFTLANHTNGWLIV